MFNKRLREGVRRGEILGGVRPVGILQWVASAVGFAAVFYVRDANSISLVMKAHAVVADSQPEFRRFNVLETLDVAFAGFQIASQPV